MRPAAIWALLLGSVLWLLAGPAWAQRATRTVEHTFSCPAGARVRVQANRAVVRVQAWDQATVQVELKLTARHPTAAIAERDLAAARYQLKKAGSLITLTNFYLPPAGAPAVQSSLQVEYLIRMPATTALEVRNAYGITSLRGLRGAQQVQQEFGQVRLQQTAGTQHLRLRYVELTALDVRGTLQCEAEQSALKLADQRGQATIRARYGSVLLSPGGGLQSAHIEAQRTEVKVGLPDPEAYDLSLSTLHSTLTVPGLYTLGIINSGGRQSFVRPGRAGQPQLRIITSYAPITLQAAALFAGR